MSRRIVCHTFCVGALVREQGFSLVEAGERFKLASEG